jgi:hypothetical protein
VGSDEKGDGKGCERSGEGGECCESGTRRGAAGVCAGAVLAVDDVLEGCESTTRRAVDVFLRWGAVHLLCEFLLLLFDLLFGWFGMGAGYCVTHSNEVILAKDVLG